MKIQNKKLDLANSQFKSNKISERFFEIILLNLIKNQICIISKSKEMKFLMHLTILINYVYYLIIFRHLEKIFKEKSLNLIFDHAVICLM